MLFKTKKGSKYQQAVLMLLNTSLQYEPVVPLVLVRLYKLQLWKVL
jgi:hypothetical protein